MYCGELAAHNADTLIQSEGSVLTGGDRHCLNHFLRRNWYIPT